jgi:TPP-dependent pyruvate/acetoin dehydrogenase alpha subunit
MHHKTKEELIKFENSVKDLWETGELPYLLHLAGGNEEQLIEIFNKANDGDWFFCSHRSHYHALLAGMTEADVMQRIKRGDSMFLFSRERNFYTSSVLAGTCCIAAGVAWHLKQSESRAHVWCFIGDGAEDNGHFYEALRYVNGQDLPCTFVIEDNDRQVDTNMKDRWGTGERFPWGGKHVYRYAYTPTYPHAGSGCKHIIKFSPEIKPS